MRVVPSRGTRATTDDRSASQPHRRRGVEGLIEVSPAGQQLVDHLRADLPFGSPARTLRRMVLDGLSHSQGLAAGLWPLPGAAAARRLRGRSRRAGPRTPPSRCSCTPVILPGAASRARRPACGQAASGFEWSAPETTRLAACEVVPESHCLEGLDGTAVMIESSTAFGSSPFRGCGFGTCLLY